MFGQQQGSRALMGGQSIVLSGDQVRAIMGAIDLVGAGEATAAQAKQAIENQISARSSIMVRETEPNKARRFPLGFLPTTVTANGGTATLSTQPQILFRPERLVIPSDIAGGLQITAIIVGQASQLAAQNNLPARTYTEQGVGVDMHLDTASISQFVQLGLVNVSAHDIPFTGQFIGLVAMG